MASDLQLQVCIVAINKMLKADGYIDICTIRDVIGILNVVPDAEAFNMLHALHCVSYKDMPVSLLSEIPGLINRCLRMQLDIKDIGQAQKDAVGNTFLKQISSMLKGGEK